MPIQFSQLCLQNAFVETQKHLQDQLCYGLPKQALTEFLTRSLIQRQRELQQLDIKLPDSEFKLQYMLLAQTISNLEELLNFINKQLQEKENVYDEKP